MVTCRALAIMLLSVSALMLNACDSQTNVDTPAEKKQTPIKASEPEAKRLGITHVQNLFDAGQTALEKGASAISELEVKVHQFLAKPNADTLTEAQNAWRDAALAYRHFDYFRHIGLVDRSRFPKLNRADYQIAGHPIQPGFLDAFGPYKFSGLVYDVGFPLTPKSLENHHGLTDVSEVVLGLYAIEFLLFNVEVARNPGDFSQVNTLSSKHRELGFQSLTEIPKNRRRKLLKLQAELLVQDYQALASVWMDKSGENGDSVFANWKTLDPAQAYRTLTRTTESALVQILTEIGELNQESPQYQHVSAQIYASSFSQKQSYICRAVHSASNAIEMQEEKADADARVHYARALELCGIETLEEGKIEKDHWREMFNAVKSTSDALANRG